MRIRVSVNSEEQYVASLPNAGFLSAHLNLSNRPKTGEQTRRLRVQGYDTSVETENTSLSWREVKLELGDTVQLSLLEDGDGTEPGEVRRSSESPKNLFENAELAAEAVDAGRAFEAGIFAILRKAEEVESEAEAAKVRRAVGHLLATLGEHWYSPIWRRHTALLPDKMRGELL
jgi:hypothetical protein